MGAERTGLLVDWGGVLTSDVFASFRAFCDAEGLQTDTVRDAFMTDPSARELLADFECGRLADRPFEVAFARVLGLDDDASLIGRLFAGMGADPAMMDAVRAFRAAGVRTGLLSNSWGADMYPADLLEELFDVVVISGHEGLRKPDPEIYALAAERMGMAPASLVFIDDLPGNLKPARTMGIATVLHRDAPTSIAELGGLLGVEVGARG